MGKVIEDDPRPGHDDDRVGEIDIRRQLRPDLLEHARRIVRKDADRTTGKRQSRCIEIVPRDERPNIFEHSRIVIERVRFEIIESDERKARDAVGAFDRLEKTRTPRRCQGEVSRDRRQRIRNKLAHDRHELLR